MSADLNLETLQRITLFVDETLEKEIVSTAIRLGVCSYICSYCSGKTLHDVFESVNRVSSLVRIEIVMAMPQAKAVTEYIQNLLQRHQRLTALIDAVIPMSAVAPAKSTNSAPGKKQLDCDGELSNVVQCNRN